MANDLRVRFVASVVVAILLPAAAWAVPSFSRQVNMGCAACHTAFPQLTPFGRMFKAAGYTASAAEDVVEKSHGRDVLDLVKAVPLSVQLISSLTFLKEAAPGTRSGDALLPDQLSLFYAGKVASEVGAFLQVTYDSQADHFSMDNADVRWAHNLKLGDHGLTLGLTLNNNPTVTDLWNTTPTWGWPYVTAGVWPGSGSSAALVDGGLAQAAAGLTAYGFLDESFYLELGAYRSAALGVARPYGATGAPAPTIDGVALYGRAAVQHAFGSHNVELGALGLDAHLFPGGGTVDAPAPLSGPTDHLTDLGVDAEWQYVPEDGHSYSLHAIYIHEARTLDASAPGESPSLNTFRVNGDACWDWFGVGAGLFATTSSTSATFGPSGSAGTGGALFEVVFRPWENVNLRAQYSVYDRIDGSTSSIDGAGRAASANNSLTLLAWLLF